MIYLSDVGRAVPQLPDNLRGMPFDTLFPVVLDRIIDRQALVAAARRQHLDDDPAVRRDIEPATSRIVEGALLAREAVPKASEDTIQARYARQYAGKPATEEARARHILVSAEDAAKRLIAELNKGADFPTLARQISKDPDHENGGDLGFFRHDQVWREFADEAFAVATGQFSQAPIHNEFGWQIVKVEERRIVAPPAYSGVHDAIRQELPQGGVAAHDLRGAVPADDPQTEHRWHTSGGGAGYHAGPGAGEIRGQPAKAVILVGLSLVRS